MLRLIVVLWLFISNGGAFAAATEPLAIQTADNRHLFQVEIANTPQQRSDGLMYRDRLPADGGMLFNFGKAEQVSMWMKNTPLPLDMMFIRSDGTIVMIAERTVPQSLTPIPSPEPVQFVLEVNGGTSARLGIQAGDKAIHKLFGAKDD